MPARVTAAQDTVFAAPDGRESETVSAAPDGRESETAGLSATSAQTDREALVALYNATNGPNWTNNTNWVSEAHLGQWHGVSTDESGRVNNLELVDNNLVGPIPSEVGDLDKLRWLELSGNKLNGSIPSEIGNLNNLWSLWLDYNALSGEIPDELGSLTNLTQMSLERNPDLFGALPLTIINLTMEYLYLGGTGICAPSTTEFQTWLSTLRTHEVADCAEVDVEALTALYSATNGPNWTNNDNWLSGAPLIDWYGVTTDETGRVEGLSLPDNNVQGVLPPEIVELSNLTTLNLSGNAGLSGQLPSRMTVLAMESLNLDGTGLCARKDAGIQDWLNSIPDRSVDDCAELDTDALVALVGLYATTGGPTWTNNENWLSQAPLAAWFGVTADADGRVTGLDLSDNNLSGALPSSLNKLANLKEIDLGSNNGLVGPMPESLTQLTIESLNLAGTGLCAPSSTSYRNWLNGIGDKSEVEECAIIQQDWETLVTFYSETNGSNWNDNTNWLSEEPLDQWFGVSTNAAGRVTSLELSTNNLLGSLPAVLGDLEMLEILDLSENELSGPIPPELGGLKNLRVLNLYFCWLAGEIPPELGSLTNLAVLDLSANGSTLTGKLPPELGNLTDLLVLSLIGNGFYGPLPAALSQLLELEVLDLRFNSFSGSIPWELGRLAKLTALRLDGNEFSGRIPRQLGRLSGLEDLHLSSNRLTGPVPGEIGALTNLTRLNLGRNELSGSVPAALSRMTALRTLDLSFNRFTGSVPGALGRLTSLTELVLVGNTGLAGPLPAEFVALNLETLMLGETGLCAPESAEFQTWLRFVQNRRVSSCVVPLKATAYLTQASQSLDYPVPLVAGEDALLRVFLKTGEEMEIPMPPVRASFYRDGHIMYVADAPGEATSVPDVFDEDVLTATANVRVPGAIVTPGVEVVIEIDPEETLDPLYGASGRIPETGTMPLDVRELPTFDLTLIPYLWVDGPDLSVLSAINGITPESDLMRPTRDLLPVNDFNLTVHPPVWTSVDPISDSVGTLGPELEVIYAVEGGRGYYMGIFRAAGPSGLLGIAQAIPSFLSFSILNPNVIAHELGHNLNLFHAPCGGAGGPDPFFPYDDGSIGVSGYDMLNESLVSPQTWDLMSYCEPMWISDYSFNRALVHRMALDAALPPPAAAAAKGLLLWGGLDEDGELTLEPAFVVDAPPKLPDAGGPYTITGASDNGGMLFSLSFAIPEYADAEGGSYAFILPVRETWSGNLHRITLSGPAGLAEIDGERDRHMALMRDEATGEVRGIFRDWPDPSDAAVAGRRIPPEPGMEITVSGGIPDQW